MKALGEKFYLSGEFGSLKPESSIFSDQVRLGTVQESAGKVQGGFSHKSE